MFRFHYTDRAAVLFNIFLTLAELAWSQVINFLHDPKTECGCSPTLRYLWSNVHQMAQQFYFILFVSGHLLNITPQMALRHHGKPRSEVKNVAP
jgi:hypothetical protein